VACKIRKMRFRWGICPDSAGEITTLPQTRPLIVSWEGGTVLPCLRRSPLELGAFDASVWSGHCPP